MCHKLKANQCSGLLTQLYPCTAACKYAENPVLWFTLPVSTVLLRIRNQRAEPFLVPASSAEGTCQWQSWMEPCGLFPARTCSQPSYFPGAVPASHFHLHMPTGVQTLNRVLQMSDRLEMQILCSKPVLSANSVL